MLNLKSKRLFQAAMTSAFALLLTADAWAQGGQQKPLTIVVAYQAGGTNDIIARTVAAQLTADTGRTVVVENRTGAGGNIGARYVAHAAADGDTILIASPGILAINQWIQSDLGYNPAKDFKPITLAASLPNVLLINKQIPVKSVAELIQYGKSHRNALNYASMGTGTSGHLNGELLKLMTGVPMEHVPYRGSAPALTDLVGNQVQLMFDNLPTALPQVKSGRLGALAVTSSERSASLPEVPTMQEAGVKGFEAMTWFGFVAPSRTPPKVIAQLNSEIVKALNNPEVKKRLAGQGATVVADSAEHFGQYIASESRKWKEVVDKAGIKKR